MNIKITYNWLLEYLDTDCDPYEIQKYLSLCGPSVESVSKIGDDFVFDIEITSNRVDMASVWGIAQEAFAILPRFGKKATLRNNPLLKMNFETIARSGKSVNLIVDSALCPRFTALILSDVIVGEGDRKIAKRLEAVGVRSINNIVDISNYVMIVLGQPSHIFDFDNIANSKMILRESKKGEKITTLDGKTYSLHGGDIVIEDGSGKLIDLCGIMGGENTHVTEKTKNILLFMQVYNGQKIRKTSMNLGTRSTASSYFEKELDPERVIPSLNYAALLLKEISGAHIDSALYDIYPKKYISKKISINSAKIDEVIGVKIRDMEVMDILESLGFKGMVKKERIEVIVPSWRARDINIGADLVEEIARIYGYFNIPSLVQKTDIVLQPRELEKLFLCEEKVRSLLKFSGFNEVYNYSMIGEDQLINIGLDPESALKLKNTISTDIEYMRPNLASSLLKNLHDNQGHRENLSFFEIANVYKKKKDDLPAEVKHLILATNTDFYELKSMVEAFFRELNIDDVVFSPTADIEYLSSGMQSAILLGRKKIGFIGQLSFSYQKKHNIGKNAFLAELNFEEMVKAASYIKTYKPINPYAVVKLDLTLENKVGYDKLLPAIKRASKLLAKIEYLGGFKNKINLRFFFTSYEKNLTEEEALLELEKIKQVAFGLTEQD